MTALLPVPQQAAHTSLLYPTPNTQAYTPLLQVSKINEVIQHITDLCDTEDAKTTQQKPWLTHEFAGAFSRAMKALGLVGDTWDKRLHKMYICCDLLCEQHTVNDLICGKKFTIRGRGDSTALAHQWVFLHILHTAREHNILHQAARHRALKREFRNPQTA